MGMIFYQYFQESAESQTPIFTVKVAGGISGRLKGWDNGSKIFKLSSDKLSVWWLRECSRQAGSKGNLRGGEAAKSKVEYFYLEISVQGKENEAWHLSSEISTFKRQVYFCINTDNLKAKHCSK